MAMATMPPPLLLLSSLLLLLVSFASATASSSSSSPSPSSSTSSSNNNKNSPLHPPPFFPAIFVFGDSLTDSGNNNHLRTLAKATSPPYGRDFAPSRGLPTGRFCNGPLSTDYIASFIGLPYPPPYLGAGNNILQGASFSSSGAGILNSTSIELGQRIPLFGQIENFRNAKATLDQMLGIQGANDLVSKSLFYVAIGSNDYIANYVVAGKLETPLQLQYSPSQFMELLLSNLEARIMDLYSMGARKFSITGLSALGCVPFELFSHRSKDGQCIQSIDDLTSAYNVALQQRIRILQSSLVDAHFTYLNTYDFLKNIISNPSAYGFESTTTACCGSGPYRAIPCALRGKVCKDASKYVFWDFVHPSSTLNKIVATRFWEGSSPDVNPFNLKQLAMI